MLKKMIVGALLVGVIGILVAGAVIRTNAVGGNDTAGEAERRGRTTESAATVSGNGGQRGGRGAQGEQSAAGNGQGERAAAGDGQGVPLADVTAGDWLTVTGTVVSVADDLVEIETATGEVIPFEGRPLSFALEQRFSLKVGDVVTLGGYDEAGEFKIGQVTNLGSGKSVTLRDTSGRPGWAGGGRKG